MTRQEQREEQAWKAWDRALDEYLIKGPDEGRAEALRAARYEWDRVTLLKPGRSAGW